MNFFVFICLINYLFFAVSFPVFTLKKARPVIAFAAHWMALIRLTSRASTLRGSTRVRGGVRQGTQ